MILANAGTQARQTEGRVPQYHKGVPIPPCPKVKVMVTRHKGRIGAGLIGGALFGPLGLAAGAMRGGRDESTWEEREPTTWETVKWIKTWREEFDRANPGFVPVPIPKKPMGWFSKGLLIFFFGIPAGVAVIAMIIAFLEKVF